MKRFFCLLLICLLLTGCSMPAAVPEEVPPVVQPPEELEAELEFESSVDVLDSEDLLTPGQSKLINQLLTRWYHFIGRFEEEDFSDLFDEGSQVEALQHAASCRTLVAIRERALEDLHLTRCDITLTVTDVTANGDEITVELDENTVMQFAGVAVESELFDLPHIFKLRQTGDDAWRITHHEADDNPYFSFTYEEGCATDPNLPLFMQNIENRQQLERGAAVPLACDHPYDRSGALDYMTTYCAYRNKDWYAYDAEGGNCMNFGSQVLLAGGIPMDYEGDARWYWESVNRIDVSFINVGSFLDYARGNTGFGLVADAEANFYTGEVGDLLIFGVNSSRHMTEICGLIQDEDGNTVDYLLCSNTTNYRNFPAAAYYYTGQRLVKIYGWND